jgi:type VI secretion system secreted protein VgrG
VQAEKDWNTLVKNDYKEMIENLQRTEAKTSIEIIVGQSSIKLEPAQITIKTPALTVDVTGETKITSGGTMTQKAAIIYLN